MTIMELQGLAQMLNSETLLQKLNFKADGNTFFFLKLGNNYMSTYLLVNACRRFAGILSVLNINIHCSCTYLV